ncbi:hypothetical protein EK21DRAFT_77352 [Setomelanomma holmii]|uniref:Uncharacterized protein n=1 Tax=Setomelanomma holmii TaxID=210430 RepID=A0A9P4LIE8_9PLEO|nr:hypothetical protein EK21DRAFT_77352 [Setomelanomma holmii]
MKFTTVVAVVLSMAAFAVAAPIPANSMTEIDVRQNHGMCVKATGGTVEQITGC